MTVRTPAPLRMVRLRAITTKVGGGATPRGDKESYKNSGITLIRSLNVYDFVFERDGLAFLDHDQAAQLENVAVQPDDILLNITGASVARCCMVPGDVLPARVNQHVAIIRINKNKADPRHVLYCINSPRYKHHLLALAHGGATREALTKETIEKFQIPLPDLPTQRKIAAILSAYDNLIENNTRRIAILEEIARSLYREWFVHFRFPGHQDVPMVESKIGRIPEDWRARRLGDLAREVRRSVSPDQVDAQTPYVGLVHIPRRSIALTEWGSASEVQSTKLRLDKGHILFGKIRPYFHKVSVAPTDGLCSSDAIMIVPKLPAYFAPVLCCVSSDEFVAEATQTSQGTKMPRANWDVLTRYPLPLPPEDLLVQFDVLVEDVVAHVQNLVLRNRNLRRTRDLLLPKLISGEVDVSELDIAEEQR